MESSEIDLSEFQDGDFEVEGADPAAAEAGQSGAEPESTSNNAGWMSPVVIIYIFICCPFPIAEQTVY